MHNKVEYDQKFLTAQINIHLLGKKNTASSYSAPKEVTLFQSDMIPKFLNHVFKFFPWSQFILFFSYSYQRAYNHFFIWIKFTKKCIFWAITIVLGISQFKEDNGPEQDHDSVSSCAFFSLQSWGHEKRTFRSKWQHTRFLKLIFSVYIFLL